METYTFKKKVKDPLDQISATDPEPWVCLNSELSKGQPSNLISLFQSLKYRFSLLI